MKQGEIYEEPSEKYQIEDFILSLHRDTIDEFDDYTHGWNGALREVLEFISKM